MSCNKTGEKFGGRAAAWGPTGHRSVGGEQFFSSASIVFLGFYFTLSSLFFLFSLQFLKIIFISF